MHSVMFLTLNSLEDDYDSDMLFYYPDMNPTNNKLKLIRGIFLTLNDVIYNLTSRRAVTSVVTVDGEKLNVCYQQIDCVNLLVTVFPAERCCLEKLCVKSVEYLQVLTAMNGNLNMFFTTDVLPTTRHITQNFIRNILGGGEWSGLFVPKLGEIWPQKSVIIIINTVMISFNLSATCCVNQSVFGGVALHLNILIIFTRMCNTGLQNIGIFSLKDERSQLPLIRTVCIFCRFFANKLSLS